MKISRAKVLRAIPWFVLWFAFVAAAVVLRNRMLTTGDAEFMGWDYCRYVSQFQDWSYIWFFGIRHPGLGVLCSPLIALEHLLPGAYLFALPLVATATALLIWRLSGVIGLLIWLSFPTTWIMAGMPESFCFAQLVLVWGALFLSERDKKCGERLPIVILVSVCNGLVTITNAVKPVVSYLAALFAVREVRRALRCMLMIAGMIVVMMFLFYLRTIVTGRGISEGMSGTLQWIPAERNILKELYGFFVRPVGIAQSFLLYPTAAYTVARFWQDGFVMMLLSWLAVDVAIHLVVGWGASEPWVYSPHWIWIFPVLIGWSFKRRESLKE